jgi:protein phosphatase
MGGELTMLIGLPASGKSGARRSLLASGDVDKAISPDEIRFRELGVQFEPRLEPIVWSVAKARMGACLAAGRRCLLDATNLDPERRKDFLAIAEDQGADSKAVVLHIAPEVARQRNRRAPLKVGGLKIGRTVPAHAMRRMEGRWEDSGLGKTKEEIRGSLEGEFDTVEVLQRYADKRDCLGMGGEVKRVGPREVCEVVEDGDLAQTIRRIFLRPPSGEKG